LIVIVVLNLLLACPYFADTRLISLDVEVPISECDVPFHLILFSPRSLRWLLRSAGWEDIRIENTPVIENPNPIRTVSKHRIRFAGSILDFIPGGNLIVS
jgi:hypothetical protein